MEPATVLRVVPGEDPALLRDYLCAHLAQERASALRGLLVHLLAPLSALVWVAAVRPRSLGLAGTDFVLGAWAVFALATVGAVLWEARWRRRCLALRRKVNRDPAP